MPHGLNERRLITDNNEWATWVPTYTNVTVGNGTEVARYVQTPNKIVHLYFHLLWGTTTSFSGTPRISLPVESHASMSPNQPWGNARFLESGVASRAGVAVFQSTTEMKVGVFSQGTTYIQYVEGSATVPFTWGNFDVLYITGSYEAA